MPADLVAGWYADPLGRDYIRYWDGTDWAPHTAPARPGLRPSPQALLAAGAPLRDSRRRIRAAAVFLVLMGPQIAVILLAPDPLLIQAAALIPGLATAVFGPRIGYRRRDALMAVLPFGGGAMLAVLLAWRLPYLPFADWQPRPEQADRWRQVTHPTDAGRMLHVPRPRPSNTPAAVAARLSTAGPEPS